MLNFLLLKFFAKDAVKSRILPVLLILAFLPPVVSRGADNPSAAQNTTEATAFHAALSVENDVEIKSRLTGVIEEIYVNRGMRVKQGDKLARLRSDDLELEVLKAEVTAKQTEADFVRAKSLFDQKLLSESDYDFKHLSFQKATAELDLAKVMLEKSVIKAPFAGVVVERYGKIGERVVEDDNIPLFRITAMEPLLARFFVPETQLAGLSTGMKAEFVADIDPSRHFTAKVKWISSVVDPASGTGAVIVEITPGEGRGFLKPGSSGKILLRLKPSR